MAAAISYRLEGSRRQNTRGGLVHCHWNNRAVTPDSGFGAALDRENMTNSVHTRQDHVKLCAVPPRVIEFESVASNVLS